MARFFITASNIFGGVAYLNHDEAEHVKVLRIKNGETFTVCDGDGKDYICRIGENTKDGLSAEIIDTVPSVGEPTVFCTVFVAYPKGDKAETIIQKCVELGASEICFYPSARCVSKPDDKTIIKKVSRWQKIALEAAKQSGRGKIPQVKTVSSFGGAVSAACNHQLPLFLYEAEHDSDIRTVTESAGNVKTVAIFTGPEGGFDEGEAKYAVDMGMKIATLGPRILRCETAPIAALTAVMLLTDNMK